MILFDDAICLSLPNFLIKMIFFSMQLELAGIASFLFGAQAERWRGICIAL
jgi:hypothetical protein